MKPIDFTIKPIALMGSKIISLLQPIANLLQVVLRNRLESQVHVYIYTYIYYYYLLTYYYIYPLTYVFSPFLRARIRVRAQGDRFSVEEIIGSVAGGK
jgi:hypothetical protein